MNETSYTTLELKFDFELSEDLLRKVCGIIAFHFPSVFTFSWWILMAKVCSFGSASFDDFGER